MKKIVATYENVVVPTERSSVKPQGTQNRSDIKKTSKKAVKVEQGGGILKTRAAKLAKDPYVTPAEMSKLDGDTKEKSKKVDESEDQQRDDSEDSQEDESKQAKRDLDTITHRAESTLLEAKAIFPFDFFPNSVKIDANKVDIILRSFFFSETVTSILLKEIMDVRVETALFFGKLIIDYGPHPLKIKSVYVANLKRHDALKAKEIIEGMLVLYRGENINTAKLKPEETMAEVREIGKVEGEE